MNVVDTHAWFWWVRESPKLSREARRALDRSAAVLVPAIVCREIASLVDRGRIKLDRDPLNWIRRSLSVSGSEIVALTPEIACRAARLHGAGGDPTDRIIAATAMELGVPLVTADTRLQGLPNLITVW